MDTIYISLPQKQQLTTPEVRLGQISTLLCHDKHVEARLKTVPIYHFTTRKMARIVCAATDLIQKIQDVYPSASVVTIGESCVLIEYVPEKESAKRTNKPLLYAKLIVICLLLFCGGAFTMITFNNDVSASDSFRSIYETLVGEPSGGFTLLEIGYAIGLPLGILLFFNHLCGHRLSTDPTPVEVSIVNYEYDVNKTLITHEQRSHPYKKEVFGDS